MTRSAWVCLCAAALALRLAALDARPVHHDEANQAVRFGALLETGQYRYDRHDHHGPTLYYLTLPAAWARGQQTLAALDETTLRLVPALFGAGLILLFPLMAGGLGRTAAAAAAALAAVSPVLTYFSRFYIQESLLALFTLGFVVSLGRCAVRPGWTAAIGAGTCAGLALATKETSLITLAVAAAAVVAARWWSGVRSASPAMRHWGAGTLAAAAIAALFFSSFFSHPAGIVEALRAVPVYLGRGLDPQAHAQPWHYYLGLLAGSSRGGLIWTEALVLGLALVGFASILTRSGRATAPDETAGAVAFWHRYVALYAVATAVIYSAIRYKTPWNVVPVHVGFVIVAGTGVATIADRVRARAARLALAVALAVGVGHLAVQGWRASVRYPADERNPFAYAQTSPDFLRLVRRLDDVASAHPDGRAMLVKVVAGPYEQWPLPWYARRLTRVGYWTEPARAGSLDDAAVVVASAEHAPAVERALGERYVTEYYGLRPGVLMAIFIERAAWERFLDARR